MELMGLKLGFALTGSFCTFAKVVPEIEKLVNLGVDVHPIMSEIAYSTDTRFGESKDFISKIEQICDRKIIHTILGAEPIGPKNFLDALVIAPCTGNTISKIANAITDSCVSMAAKASIRNENPLVIAVSTNDGLGSCAKNIGTVLNFKNVYFVPFTQDDAENKHNSLVADMTKITPTITHAINGKQLQPILCRY